MKPAQVPGSPGFRWPRNVAHQRRAAACDRASFANGCAAAASAGAIAAPGAAVAGSAGTRDNGLVSAANPMARRCLVAAGVRSRALDDLTRERKRIHDVAWQALGHADNASVAVKVDVALIVPAERQNGATIGSSGRGVRDAPFNAYGARQRSLLEE